MNIAVVILLGLLIVVEFANSSLLLRLIFKVEDFINDRERKDQ